MKLLEYFLPLIDISCGWFCCYATIEIEIESFSLSLLVGVKGLNDEKIYPLFHYIKFDLVAQLQITDIKGFMVIWKEKVVCFKCMYHIQDTEYIG